VRFKTLFALVLLAAADAGATLPESTHPAMLDPSKATAKAPETFKAKFDTTKGDVVFECTRAWAPNGVDRFYDLVRIGFFDGVAIFRVVPGFVAQWGIHGDPKVSAAWQSANIPPDPPKQSNTRGMLTYAMGGSPDTRSTQLFVSYGDNSQLDAQGFAPICKVTEGMEVADSFYSGYGEKLTHQQGAIAAQGNAYLEKNWPKLDYIKKASIVGEAPDPQLAWTTPAETKDESTSTATSESGGAVPWIIGGLIVVGLGFMMFRGKKEEPPPPPPKKKRKKKTQS